METVVDGILTVDGIIVMNSKGTILKANQSTLNLFRCSIEEIVGRNIHELIPSIFEDSPNTFDESRRQNGFANLMGVGREAVGLRMDDSKFPLELSIGESTFDEEKIFTAIVRDITERKEAQELLLAARNEAERSSLAKSDFLSHMSHELRTPLNAVLGYAQLMEMGSDDPKTIEAAKSIIKGGRHLLELISEVLDLTRIQAGAFSITLESVNLANILNQTFELILPAANERDIDIALLAGSVDQIYAMADRQRLTQVVLNLLSNAVK
ncbi:MAG: hypothetical protein C4320_05345 [Armatimonadota bacterium]